MDAMELKPEDIRGVNVFPSQIEEVLLKVSGGQLTPKLSDCGGSGE